MVSVVAVGWGSNVLLVATHGTLVELTQARAQFAQSGFDRVKARYALLKQGVALAYYRGDWGQMRTLLARLENPK